MASPALDLFVSIEPETEGAEPERLEVTPPAEARAPETSLVPRSKIHPDPDQPRKDAADWLRASLAKQGMLEPIGVRPVPPMEGRCSCCETPWATLGERGDYMIIYGECRWRSAEGILYDLPAIIRNDLANRAQRRIVQLAENAHRPMRPLDEARAYRDILDDTGWSHARIAAETGRKRQVVSDRLALLKNDAWVPLLESGEISSSQMVEVSRYADAPADEHAKAIAAMRDLAGAAGLAAMDVKVFREQLRIVGYFDPDPLERDFDRVEQTSISDVEQSAGDGAAETIAHVADALDLDIGDAHVTQGVDVERALQENESRDPQKSQSSENGTPAHHEDDSSESSHGTAPASLETSRSQDGSASEGEGDVRPDASPELPATEPTNEATKETTYPSLDRRPRGVAGAGFFQHLIPLLGGGATTIMLGPGRHEGTYRVTIQPPKGKGKATLSAAVIADGTPAELDADLPGVLARHGARVGTGVVVTEPAKSGALVAAAAKSPRAAKRTSAKSSPKAKRAAKKSAAKKSLAKKAAANKAAKPVARKKPAKPRLYPDAALAAVLGLDTEIKLPATVKDVIAYAKRNNRIGEGGLRGMISCDDKLQALFSTTIVKLKDLKKLLKKHLVERVDGAPESQRPDPANGASDDSQTEE